VAWHFVVSGEIPPDQAAAVEADLLNAAEWMCQTVSKGFVAHASMQTDTLGSFSRAELHQYVEAENA
jgi:hypothetical protein